MKWTESLDMLLQLGPFFVLQFITAVLCGGAIGMERERSGKPAGLRTTILVCIGGMLFTVLSVQMAHVFGGDPTRIAAQIITGVAFLGAGAILRGGDRGVFGLTTAAIIWVTTAIGMLIGAGYIVSSVGITVSVVVMLLLLQRFEKYLRNRNAIPMSMLIASDESTRRQVRSVLYRYDTFVSSVSITAEDTDNSRLSFVFVGHQSQRSEMLAHLCDISGVHPDWA